MNKTSSTADNAATAPRAMAAVAAPSPQPDEHAGKGGMYELVDGKRVLVARTSEHPATSKAPKAD